MRYRLLETIVPLAAPADQLVDYVHADGSDIDEAISDFVDWTYQSTPGLINAGALPDDLAPALRLLRDQALAAAQSAPEEECATAVFRPEWSTLRTTANAVLNPFRALGVPIPSMASGLLGDLTTVPRSERWWLRPEPVPSGPADRQGSPLPRGACCSLLLPCVRSVR
jgi:hypothetical protein